MADDSPAHRRAPTVAGRCRRMCRCSSRRSSRTVQISSRFCLRPSASAPTTSTAGKAQISIRGFGGTFAEVRVRTPTPTVHSSATSDTAERQFQSRQSAYSRNTVPARPDSRLRSMPRVVEGEARDLVEQRARLARDRGRRARLLPPPARFLRAVGRKRAAGPDPQERAEADQTRPAPATGQATRVAPLGRASRGGGSRAVRRSRERG